MNCMPDGTKVRRPCLPIKCLVVLKSLLYNFRVFDRSLGDDYHSVVRGCAELVELPADSPAVLMQNTLCVRLPGKETTVLSERCCWQRCDVLAILINKL